MTTTRRQLLASAGTTALVASLGSDLFTTLGFAAPRLRGGDDLDLGDLGPLADLFEEVPLGGLMERLVRELRAGQSLERLVAAGALANARALGGEDYEGYHAFMGMVPALAIAREMPTEDAPLPVLKTLKRSAVRMRAAGRTKLTEVEPEPGDPRAAVRERELARAERALAAHAKDGASATWNALHPVIVDDIEVHLVVFAWRAKEISDLAGPEHALTSMRQILHFADGREARRRRDGKPEPAVRTVVPSLIEQHELAGGAPGIASMSDEALSELADVLVTSSRADGAAACAQALADGAPSRDVSEALCLASTRLLLRDRGRQDGAKGRPKGSVHGASVGVHASDSALAWREIAETVPGRAQVATLLAGGFHTAGQGAWSGRAAYPYAKHLEWARGLDRDRVAGALAEAAAGGDQRRAGAAAHRMSELGMGEQLFTTLRPVSVGQDGALHAEKYQHTARVVHGFSREAFRREHLVAYARVVASQACATAPEVEEARALLG